MPRGCPTAGAPTWNHGSQVVAKYCSDRCDAGLCGPPLYSSDSLCGPELPGEPSPTPITSGRSLRRHCKICCARWRTPDDVRGSLITFRIDVLIVSSSIDGSAAHLSVGAYTHA